MNVATIDAPHLVITELLAAPEADTPGAPQSQPAPSPPLPPLLLLHGFSGDTSTWGPFVTAWAALGRSDRAVWAVDLAGHGRSPTPASDEGYTVPAQAAGVASALRRLGAASAVWLGYSMGGRVALTAAAQADPMVTGLILVGASPGIDDSGQRAERAAADHALADSIERDGLAAFVARWEALPLFAGQARLGPEHAAQMRAQRMANDPAALAASLRKAGQGVMPPLGDALDLLRPPCLLVAGAEDERYVRLHAAMAARIPDAEHRTVPDAGHAVQLEAPTALARHVRAWLDRRRTEPPCEASGSGGLGLR